MCVYAFRSCHHNFILFLCICRIMLILFLSGFDPHKTQHLDQAWRKKKKKRKKIFDLIDSVGPFIFRRQYYLFFFILLLPRVNCNKAILFEMRTTVCESLLKWIECWRNIRINLRLLCKWNSYTFKRTEEWCEHIWCDTLFVCLYRSIFILKHLVVSNVPEMLQYIM